MSHHRPYRGRFAPSPSGPLHFGSLIAATASYLQARSQQGEWFLRIDDIDENRTVKGADQHIIQTLEQFAFEWQGEIIYQSHCKTDYQDALQQLIQQHLIYSCDCSRQKIRQQTQQGAYGYIYNGHCRHKKTISAEHALRLRTENKAITFDDAILGHQQQNLETEVGDFIVRRRDQLFAYQLAIVVDDEKQGITDIIRGADLLDSSARQIYLQQQLAYTTPRYAHLPLATSPQGGKLSKLTAAPAINPQDAVSELFKALLFLGQQPPKEALQSDINSLWQWAIQHWSLQKIPPQKNIIVPL